ncbi:hypothetical protein [Hymenobacter sediminicola]|uniref:Lipoprotein n=1 Tax=Hymenobacter sediminicola TaxID=2761579 RepID=A0A7G7W9U2_9BACT|nr:hypothetical protein [Hymenobacter sediminicola]QNH63135.1 hypothetical protein H4317_04815 [Hymenobacter sediminicola]
MRTALLFPLFGLLVACSTPDTRQAPPASATTPDTVTRLEPMDTARARATTPQSDTLKTVRSRHVFSAPASPDEFRLTLRGKDVLTGEITFTITDAAGQVIFREILTPADLEASMVNEMKTPTVTPAEREAYIRRRMDEFFAEKNFRKPALAAKDTYQEGGADRATWEDIQKRPDAVGFVYLVGKEDRRRIAYSPRTKQVVQLPGLGS